MSLAPPDPPPNDTLSDAPLVAAGSPPDIRSFLAQVPVGERPALLAQLLPADRDRRRALGLPVTFDSYLERLPEYGNALAELLTDDSAATAADTDPQVPDRAETPRIDGYLIERELGRGGMGVVYQALHLALKRTVALKVILSGVHASDSQRARFCAEAAAIARLAHPNIVQIHEIGEQDGKPYFALEFCSGGSLDARLGGIPQPPTEAARLIETLARAIAVAHHSRIVHRDLKPANILLTTDGTPKITDFGLAKQLDEAALTNTGTVIGSPAYMAPEQAAGASAMVGPAADLYSLGVVLYEMLTGGPPFKAATIPETLRLVAEHEPPSPRAWNPALPRDLEIICLKCLQKDPGKRYDSALSLAEDLRRFQRGEPIRARAITRLEQGWRWCRRNPSLALLWGGLAASLIVGIAVATALAFLAWNQADAALAAGERADERAQAALVAQQAADRNARRALDSERLAHDRAYNSDLRLLQQAWDKSQFDFARKLLDRQRPEVTDGVDRRGWEWHYWDRLATLPLVSFAAQHDVVRALAFSPDNRTLATGAQDYAKREWVVKLWDAGTGREVRAFPSRATKAYAVAFSPDGKRLATVGSDPVVFVWDTASGDEALTLRGHAQWVNCVKYSADGKRIATGSGDNTVRLWDAATGKETRAPLDHRCVVECVAFSPDGTLVAAGGWGQAVSVWDVATGQVRLTLGGHKDQVRAVHFSPDGKRLVSASADGKVRVWDVARGGDPVVFDVSTGQVYDVAFSRDGALLATISGEDGVKVWDAATAQHLYTYFGATGRFGQLAFSPDDKRLACGSGQGRVLVWDLQPARASRLLTGTGQVEQIALSAAGDLLGARTGAGNILLCNTHSGTEYGRVASLPGALVLALHPQGTQVVVQGSGALVEVWDGRSGKLLHRAERNDLLGLTAAAYHPDGNSFCLAALNGKLAHHSGTDFRVTQTWEARAQVFAIAYNADGKYLFCRSGWGIQVWEAATGKLHAEMVSPAILPAGFACSADGQFAAVGDTGGGITVWDVVARKEAARLTGHTGWVQGLSFSLDGKRLVSASDDRAVKVWDLRSGEELLTLPTSGQPFRCVLFSPCGRKIFGGYPGGVRVWETGKSPEK